MTTKASYTRRFWAKSDRNNPERIHLLECHLADVGACFEALLAQPVIRRRLAQSGGRDDLDPATVARLSLLAALHDIGKVNVGFQTQIWRNEDLPESARRPRRAGHTLDLTPLLNGNGDTETSGWFFDALGWWWDAVESWDDRGGATVCALLIATLSHHGRPLCLKESRQPNPGIWRRYGDLRPQEQVSRIGRLARDWFPAAFTDAGPPLPAAPAFQHHFLGLCNLADWIGSNERWFEYVAEPRNDYIATARANAERAVNDVGLNRSAQRAGFSGLPDFADLFGLAGGPNAIQQAAQDTPLDAPLVIIESETGSGKTEAALWRFARMYEAGLVDGLYFALPTRSAAVQIHERVHRFIGRLFPNRTSPETVLAVPGYLRAGDAAGQRLQDYAVWWDDHAADGRRWAAESTKRYLAAQIAVGTVDQALLGALMVKNAHLRTACLARSLLVVDEVHASDTYMSEILAALLDAHLGSGGQALLMSATLGSVARQRWRGEPAVGLADAIAVAYPAVSARHGVRAVAENGAGKTVSIKARPIMGDPAAIAQSALEAARAGAKVLVVRNTVGYAIRVHQAIEEIAGDDAELLFAVNGIPTLHHGRFAAPDRRLLDRRIEELLGRERESGGRIVVGTQTLEQSLDIDADLLITDLSPMDVLLQRIGRLHRHRRDDRPHDYATPQCIALTPPDDDLSPLLTKGNGQTANGLGPYGGVYRSLHILEATRRLIAEYPEWRIPAMNRKLVESATHGEALDRITKELGDQWQEHKISTTGALIADQQTAHSHLIRRDKSFFEDNGEVCFPSDDKWIRTRLGDDRVEIAFNPPLPSPFDSSGAIDRMALPLGWLERDDAPDSVEPTATDGGGFAFRIGSHRFRYDRLGLRRE